MKRVQRPLLISALLLLTGLQVVADEPIDLQQIDIRSLIHDLERENSQGEDEGGIGGTGIIARADEDGIGGTGIIGEITGFGSIIVNGVHVDYNPQMVVQNRLGMMTAKQLQIGQVVALEASQSGERYIARSIALRHPVVGPITRISPDGRSIQVMGQTVLLDGERLHSERALEHLKVGDPVAVSGFWDRQTIHATRLAPGAGGYASISGPVKMRANQPYIGAVPIEFADSLRGGVEAGVPHTLFGSANRERGLIATRAVRQPENPFSPQVKRVLVEGYPERATHGQRLGGLRMEGAHATPGKRQIIQGEVIQGNRIRTTAVQRPGAGRAAWRSRSTTSTKRSRKTDEDRWGQRGSREATTPQRRSSKPRSSAPRGGSGGRGRGL